MKPCIECGKLVARGSRCAVHERKYGRAWAALSARILARDGHRCHYCGKPARTVDHVLPVAAGGTDDPSNLVAACRRCNARKGSRV